MANGKEPTLEQRIASLQHQGVAQLRRIYAETFGETTNAGNKSWLIKKIAWRMQANRLGGLTERAVQRAKELANDADLRVVAPKAPSPEPATNTHRDPRIPAPGTVIARDYKGRTLKVSVLADGFEFQGEKFSSLSAIAKLVTGSHCNGMAFFKLTTPDKTPGKGAH